MALITTREELSNKPENRESPEPRKSRTAKVENREVRVNASKDNYQIRAHKIKLIVHTGPQIWNALPHDIKNAKSIGQFKTYLSSYLSLDIQH